MLFVFKLQLCLLGIAGLAPLASYSFGLLAKFVGTNLNKRCLARRVDYMDVIHKEKQLAVKGETRPV